MKIVDVAVSCDGKSWLPLGDVDLPDDWSGNAQLILESGNIPLPPDECYLMQWVEIPE